MSESFATREQALPWLLSRHEPLGTALLFAGRRYRWGALDGQAKRVAAWLQARGVAPGDRVAVWMVNRVDWLALLFGVAYVGAMLVAVNTRYRAGELRHILAQSGARMLVMQTGFRQIDFAQILRSVDRALVPELQSVVLVGDMDEVDLPGIAIERLDIDRLDAGAFRDHSSADSVVVLFPTSGTTRGPKLVMHTQGTLTLHSQHVARAHALADGGGLLCSLPLCGALGLNGVLAAFAAGVPVALQEIFQPAEAASLVREHGLGHAYGSDEMFRQLLAQSTGDPPFPSARDFGFGAFQSGAVEFARRARERGVPMAGIYGSSELQAAFARQRTDAGTSVTHQLEAGGHPAAPDAGVRIRDAVSGDLLPPGARGDIEIRSPTQFVGYFRDPEAMSAAMTADGYFRTGDIGYLRGDGSFVFEGRRGDAMRLAGFLVDPTEIEDVLRADSRVADAQAVAVAIGGQPRCVAFVVPVAGKSPSPAVLVAAAASRLAAFKVPSRIWLIDRLPTTDGPNGVKVQRARLREDAARRVAESNDEDSDRYTG